MVTAILQPLTIFLLGLGGGFLIPLVYRVAKPLPAIVFLVALSGMTLISGFQLWRLMNGEPTIEIYTAGALPPFSINLRFGLWEGFFAFSVNVAAMIGVWQLWERLRGSYAALLLYLILVMGINGMVMTRDLFNQFVFLEIVSIATYGLLGMERGGAMLSASFKYIMATVLASSAFLLGAVLLYHVTGTLNIDDMIEHRTLITGPIGTTALLLVLSGLILELKPFPANGWGLDVYETAPSWHCRSHLRRRVGGRLLRAFQAAAPLPGASLHHCRGRAACRSSSPILPACRRRRFSGCSAIRRSRRWGC